MTATATPTSQAITEWTKVFPKQITENYTSSVTFMKQLTVIALSTITYLRNAFPEESYSLENFGGLKLRILKKKCRDELAHFISTALTQAFEAFDKKYLHQLALCFYEDECKVENLIEYHVFEYSYNSEAVTMSIHSKTRDSAKQTSKYTFNGVRERTILLIRACVVIMQSYKNELPESYDVSIRLYYNEDAPEGYQAPGFITSPEADDHLEATLNDTTKLGYVETPYHKIVARTFVRDSMGSSHEAIASQNPPLMTQMEQEEFYESAPKDTSDSSEKVICCPCNKQDFDQTVTGTLLLCQYCGTYQHAACFGLRGGSRGLSGRHCCARCAAQRAGRTPTDARLTTASHRKRECLCVFRRTLWYCAGVGAGADEGAGSGSVSAASLAAAVGLSAASAVKLLRLLRDHGVIAQAPHSDLNTPCSIIPERLKSIMSQYFQESAEENIVDRLVAETLASQENKPDPVGDVLGPLEKVSLQNASSLGRVIENPADGCQLNVEDSTLKQYKEALLSTFQAEEDLPLSGSHDPIKDIENLGKKRTIKRKMDENEDKPRLRTGIRNKKAKTKE